MRQGLSSFIFRTSIIFYHKKLRFAPYQLIEILLFCQSTWRGLSMSDRRRREQIDLCVGSASAIRLLPYRVFGSVYCCLASCVLFLGPPSSVRYSISSPFIPIFPFLRSRDEQRSWRWGKQCRVGFAAATTWVPWGTARSPHGSGSADRGCRRMIRGGLGKGRLHWWRGFPARGDDVSPWRASVGSPWR